MDFIELLVVYADSITANFSDDLFSEDAFYLIVKTNSIKKINNSDCHINGIDSECAEITFERQTTEKRFFILESYESIKKRLSKRIFDAPKLNQSLLETLFL